MLYVQTNILGACTRHLVGRCAGPTVGSRRLPTTLTATGYTHSQLQAAYAYFQLLLCLACFSNIESKFAKQMNKEADNKYTCAGSCQQLSFLESDLQ